MPSESSDTIDQTTQADVTKNQQKPRKAPAASGNIINSADDFKAAVEYINQGNTATYTLGTDINIGGVDLEAGSLTLLGDGHTMTFDGGAGALGITTKGSASLTLGNADGSDSLTVISTDTTNPIICVTATSTFDMYEGVTLGPSSSSGTCPGVQVNDSGTFNMHGGLITGCESIYEWFTLPTAVLVDGTGATFNMSGGTISGCKGKSLAAVAIGMGQGGSFYMTGGSITDNTNSGSYGGGLYTGANSTVSLTGGLITNNTARYGGGAFFSSDATVNGTEIYNNTGTGAADDLYISRGCTVDLAAAPAEALSPCGHTIDGWYSDIKAGDSYNRWAEGADTNILYQPGSISGSAYLKAAHGELSQTIDISGTVSWSDSNNQDGIRPTSVTVNLLADGKVVDTQTATADDNWAFTFAGKQRETDGKEVVYTVEESGLPSTYTKDVTGSAASGFAITNTYTPATVNVAGKATWVDSNDKDGKRPSTITIKLLANGKEAASATVTANSNWTWEFPNMPKYAQGKEIVYTISEAEIPDYTIAINGFDVTNTHEIAAPVPGSKTNQTKSGGSASGDVSQSTSESSDVGSPNTGDNETIELWAFLVASMLVAGISLFSRREG